MKHEENLPTDPELEARIVAWVLGEASPFEAAELERRIAADPTLAEFKRRIEAVHGFVGEAERPASSAGLRMSAEKRAKLLAAIGEKDAENAGVAVVGGAPVDPQEGSLSTDGKGGAGDVEQLLSPHRVRRPRWGFPAWAIAAAACLTAGLFVVYETGLAPESSGEFRQIADSRKAKTATENAAPSHGFLLKNPDGDRPTLAQRVTGLFKKRSEPAPAPAQVVMLPKIAAPSTEREKAIADATTMVEKRRTEEGVRADYLAAAAAHSQRQRTSSDSATGAKQMAPFVVTDEREGYVGAAATQQSPATPVLRRNDILQALDKPALPDLSLQSSIANQAPALTLEGAGAAAPGKKQSADLPPGIVIYPTQPRVADASNAFTYSGGTAGKPMGSVPMGAGGDSGGSHHFGFVGGTNNAGELVLGTRATANTPIGSAQDVAAVAGSLAGGSAMADSRVNVSGVLSVTAMPAAGVALSGVASNVAPASASTRGLNESGSWVGGADSRMAAETGASSAPPPMPEAINGDVANGAIVAAQEPKPANVPAGSGAMTPPSADAEVVKLDAFEVATTKDRHWWNFGRSAKRAAPANVASAAEARPAAPTPMQTILGVAAESDRPIVHREPPIDEVLRSEVPAVAQPFSTFSLHVADVSFQLALAALDRGELPDPGAIRPEEFYNAFNYGDPAPLAGEPVACRIEQAQHPFLQQRNLVRIAMKVPAAGRGAGQPLRLTVLLDTSGSMERSDRVATVQRAFGVLASLLGPADEVTLIGFARQPRLLAVRVRGDQAGNLVGIVAHTPADGGTNLEEALKLAATQARAQFTPAAQNRVVVLTDGAANLGNDDPAHLAAQVEALRQQGIAFDACGIGVEGLDDSVLEALTRKGDGRYYVINSPEEADAGFARKLAGAFHPAAENVKVQVRFNPDRVQSYRLIGFEQHRLRPEDFRNDQVDAAELAAEEGAVALYQVEVKPDGEGELGDVFVRFRHAASGAMVERSWTLSYQPQPPTFDRATPTMELAGTAALLAEKLRGGAPAGQIRLAELAPVVNRLRLTYAHDARVQDLVRMFETTRRLLHE